MKTTMTLRTVRLTPPDPRCTTSGLRILCLAGVIGTAAALAGCGTSPPTRFYTLEAVAPITQATATAFDRPPLQVRAVHLPPAWDRIELLRQVAPGQVQVREFDQWAAPLGRSAQQTLTQDLTARLPAGAVLFPQAARGGDTATATEVTVDILTLRIDSRSASMQVSWALRSSAAAGWRSAPPTTLEVPMSGDDGDATALAVSRLLGQLADRIAAAAGVPAPM